MRRFWNTKTTIDDLVRESRPEAPAHLVRRLTARVSAEGSRRTGLAPRTVRVAALTTALLIALGAVGGLGYAMTSVTNIVTRVATHKIFIRHTTVRTVVINAANDQYGTTTTTTSTSTTTTTTSSGGETAAVAQPGQSGAINTTAPGTTQQISVGWDASTFGKAVIVSVDPTPPITNTTLLGSGNDLVSVVVTDPNTSARIHALAAPLEVLFRNAPAGFVPVISEDGINFRALKQISGPPLPADMQDGYYVDGVGVHVLTRHVTVFAVLYRANVTHSESGRKTQAPGSGKFGDPTRIHVGPPALKLAAAPVVQGKNVLFTFFVDEQAAAYFRVMSGDRALTLNVDRSRIRGERIGGTPRRTLHQAILRPGTIKMRLNVPAGLKGKLALQLTVVDFDGNKVAKTVTVSR